MPMRPRTLLPLLLSWSIAVPCTAETAATLVAGADPEFASMIARCAPTVAPVTMAALVSTESRGHRYAIADAGPVNMPWAQRKKLVRSYYLGSTEASVAKAEALISSGHTVSLGLSQVNDRNLSKMGLTVREMFDPCTNLRAGGKIITAFYARASTKFGPGERALRAALSAYNSGDWIRGEHEGYVGRVYRQKGRRLAMDTTAHETVVPSINKAGGDGIRVSQRAPDEHVEDGRTFTLSASEFVVEK